MNKILLAGSTGYLGNFILNELSKKEARIKVIVRSKKRLWEPAFANGTLEITEADLTVPASIENCCRDIDTVISTVGITRQKDGLTYMDVDYQANLNLLNEAKGNGVKKFIYVSVLNGDKMTALKMCAAKEKFVDALKNSGLDYCVVCPNGYFSDMSEFYTMARKGRVYLFGNGEHKINPIDGADLAKVCVEAIPLMDKEILVGGPQVLTYNQIAEIAFSVANKTPKIVHIPDWVRKSTLFLLRTLTSSKFYGPIEFFMTVLSMDMIAPAYGSHTLEAYFRASALKK